MATITVSQGNYISDVVLNGTGLISNWNAILQQNNFSEWVPDLINGQVIEIPDGLTNNPVAIANLKQYPANNFSVPDIYNQIDQIFALLAIATPTIAPVIAPTVKDTNTYYEVRNGEELSDVILNSSGDILNWFTILQAGQFLTWTPDLINGELIAIPADIASNLNNFRALNQYPANNFSVSDVYDQIAVIFDELNNPIRDWILYSPDGKWSDINHYFRDGAFWLD